MLAIPISEIRVLIVDPDPQKGGATVARSLLMTLGVGMVREAADAARAFMRIQQAPPNLVIATMDTAEAAVFAERLRRDPTSPHPQVPLIVVAAPMDADALRRLRDAGVNEVLIHPTTASALKLRIEAAIGQPRPFIFNKHYVGPSRRRSTAPYNGPERRRRPRETA